MDVEREDCKECDEANPHPAIPGQRRAVCDACGYRSHWINATLNKMDDGRAFVVVNGGYQADWRDGEYDVSMYTEGRRFRDGKAMRISLCCYAPVRADIEVRRKRGA